MAIDKNQKALLLVSPREQLKALFLFCILQGVSVLELQSDSLHTAAECCDGVENEITCLEPPQQPAVASQCLVATTGGSLLENGSVENNSSSVDCGHVDAGNAEKDWSLSVSTPESEVRPQETSLNPPEDWVCLSSNTGRDYCQTEEEEGRDQPVFPSQSLSLCDGSEEAQSEAERESLTVGILPPAGCGKQAEETDRGEAECREGQEATKGKETSEQEAARRKEEETNSELTDLITQSDDTKASVMGQSLSPEGSASETKGCHQEGRSVGKEEMKLSQELCGGLASDEGLTDTSTPGDTPNPSLIDCDDVIVGPKSAVPPLLIEGLHEGEPPPDINSLEQNQETAVRDYVIEQQQGLAPETACHFGKCTESASAEELVGEHVAEPSGYSIESANLSPLEERDHTAASQTAGNPMEDGCPDLSTVTMPSSSSRHADLASETTRRLSSDDDCSFRSIGSSTTEIFHPTSDNVSTEDLDFLEPEVSSTGFKLDEPKESELDLLTTDEGVPLEPGSVNALTATDCSQPGTHADSQLLPSLQTMEALNIEETGEDLDPQPKEDLLLGPDNRGALTTDANESGAGEASGPELNAGTEHLESEVDTPGLCETSPSGAEKCGVTDPGEEDQQPSENSVNSTVDSAEENGDVPPLLQEPKQDDSKTTADERPQDEGCGPPTKDSDASSSQAETSLLDNDDVKALGVEPPSPNNEASSEPQVNSQMTENPKALDTVDTASPSAIQGRQIAFLSLPYQVYSRFKHRHSSQDVMFVIASFINKYA